MSLLSFVVTSLSHGDHRKDWNKTFWTLNANKVSYRYKIDFFFLQNYTIWSRFIFLYKKLIYVERSYILYKNYSWSSSFDSLPHIFICLYIFTRKGDELSLSNTNETKIFIVKKYSNPMERTTKQMWAVSRIQTRVF